MFPRFTLSIDYKEWRVASKTISASPLHTSYIHTYICDLTDPHVLTCLLQAKQNCCFLLSVKEGVLSVDSQINMQDGDTYICNHNVLHIWQDSDTQLRVQLYTCVDLKKDLSTHSRRGQKCFISWTAECRASKGMLGNVGLEVDRTESEDR